jgi:hypothetical protein
MDGLTATQWGICVGVGAASLIVNFLLKFVPDKFWPTMGEEKPEDVAAAAQDYKNLQTRKLRETSSLRGKRQG